MAKLFKKNQLLLAELRQLQALLKSESIILSMVSGRDFLKSKSKKQREKRRV
ncbi:hypothetical protein L917_05709, partial [Phytophthora nicotianae]